MSFLILLMQAVLSVLLTPVVVDKGLRNLFTLATPSNFNLRYQLHFAVSQYGQYVAALILAIVFWLIGRILARVLRRPRVPSLLTLLATLVLALGLAHLSTLPLVADLATAIYARTYMAVPSIIYPLIGCVIAALLVRGTRAA